MRENVTQEIVLHWFQGPSKGDTRVLHHKTDSSDFGLEYFKRRNYQLATLIMISIFKNCILLCPHTELATNRFP